MPIDEAAKEAFKVRVRKRIVEGRDFLCPNEHCPAINEWEFGEVGVVTGAYFDKAKQRIVALSDGLVVPTLCPRCKSIIKYYDELPDAP